MILRGIPLLIGPPLVRSVDKRFLRLTIGAYPCRDAHFASRPPPPPPVLSSSVYIAFRCTVAQGASVCRAQHHFATQCRRYLPRRLRAVMRLRRGVPRLALAPFVHIYPRCTWSVSRRQLLLLKESPSWLLLPLLPASPSRRYVRASGRPETICRGSPREDLFARTRTGSDVKFADNSGCGRRRPWVHWSLRLERDSWRSAPTCLNANLNVDSSPYPLFPCILLWPREMPRYPTSNQARNEEEGTLRVAQMSFVY
jgi:hypothetical protein